MKRLSLLDGAILVAPKDLPKLDEYLTLYPDTNASRYDLSELASLFFAPIYKDFYLASRDIFPLSKEALKWLLALLPSDPTNPRFQALRQIPSFPKKKVPKEIFRNKNVVYLGFVPMAGRIFSALLQDVPNLSSSWALPSFGIGKGIGVKALEELYRVLNEEEIAELCLPSFEEFQKAKLEECALALPNGSEMK